jgi:hypothetical protein
MDMIKWINKADSTIDETYNEVNAGTTKTVKTLKIFNLTLWTRESDDKLIIAEKLIKNQKKNGVGY